MRFAFKPCALDHLVLHQESTIGMIDYMDKYHSLIPTSLGTIPRNGKHLSQDGVSILNFNISKVPKVHELTHCSSHSTEGLELSVRMM